MASANDIEGVIKALFFFFALILLVISFLFLPFVIMAHNARREKQAKAMSLKADQLDLDFSHAPDREFASSIKHLDSLDTKQGSDRYALNILKGSFDGHPVVLFDYHYSTSGVWWWSPSWKMHNYVSIVMLELGQEFPELTIGPEGGGLFAMIAEAFGGGDIDFESHEFSERFDVRSKNKKFAYDFCNAQMIEYLLHRRGTSLEVDGSTLAMGFGNMHETGRIEPRLKSLAEIRSLMPNYLFEPAVRTAPAVEMT